MGSKKGVEPSRKLLETYQIDINSVENTIALVGGKGASKQVLPRHHRGVKDEAGLHSPEAGQQLNARLGNAVVGAADWQAGREALLKELAKIKQEIVNGTFPLGN